MNEPEIVVAASPPRPVPAEELREQQIALGTVTLDSRELAPRLGLHGRWAWKTVLEWVALGRLPAIRTGGRSVQFHWPTVVEALNKGLPPMPRRRPDPRRIKKAKP